MTEVLQGNHNPHSFHLAGIIPVSGKDLDYNFPWHDSLMPLAPDYTAVENAVYQCASAGCETIWIVGDKGIQPLLRHKVGEWVIDPMTSPLMKRRYIKFADLELRQVPIYYVPIHPKDKGKRDCLSWSVLYGVTRAFQVSYTISKWVIPDKYFVAFPYGVNSAHHVRKNRRMISSNDRFFLRHNGKTVADGEYLSFTMDAEDFKNYRKNFRSKSTGKYINGFWDEEHRTIKGDLLPLEERWSARHFEIDNVFDCAKIEDAGILDIDDYYDISSWDGYREYMSSDLAKKIKRPYEIKYHEWNKIALDEEIDTEF